MKLTDLATQPVTKNISKVMESYFNQRFDSKRLTPAGAYNMLGRVRGLISEHRGSPDFHTSERNPAYLKLVMLEQGLTAYLGEEGVPVDMNDPKVKAAMQKAEQGGQLTPEEDGIVKAVALTKENAKAQAKRVVKESEVQEAQVVLAAQDMVDRIQGWLEDVSEMQFKELPALVDSIKNEIGTEQAAQFNADAAASLTALLQNLQTAKASLEGSLGVVTGQAPQIPGADMAPAEEPAVDVDAGEEDVSAELDLEEPEEETGDTGLGRERR